MTQRIEAGRDPCGASIRTFLHHPMRIVVYERRYSEPDRVVGALAKRIRLVWRQQQIWRTGRQRDVVHGPVITTSTGCIVTNRDSNRGLVRPGLQDKTSLLPAHCIHLSRRDPVDTIHYKGQVGQYTRFICCIAVHVDTTIGTDILYPGRELIVCIGTKTAYYL